MDRNHCAATNELKGQSQEVEDKCAIAEATAEATATGKNKGVQDEV